MISILAEMDRLLGPQHQGAAKPWVDAIPDMPEKHIFQTSAYH